jgi:hypothetical protein
MRIGPRYNRPCTQLLLCDNCIEYVSSLKYLGVVLKSAKKFTCTFDHVKLKFYRAFNALYAKSKAANSELVSVHLSKAFCVPLIMYALEVTDPTPRALRMLDGLVVGATRKIFSITDSGNVQEVRRAVGLHNIETLYLVSLSRFLLSFCKRSFSFAQLILDFAIERIKPIFKKFNISNVLPRVLLLQALVTNVTAAL